MGKEAENSKKTKYCIRENQTSCYIKNRLKRLQTQKYTVGHLKYCSDMIWCNRKEI